MTDIEFDEGAHALLPVSKHRLRTLFLRLGGVIVLIVMILVVVMGFRSGWSWTRVEQAWKATATYPQSDKLACTAINTLQVDVTTSKPVSDSTRSDVIKYGQKAADVSIQEATFHLGQAINANSSTELAKALQDYSTECDSLGLGPKSNAP